MAVDIDVLRPNPARRVITPLAPQALSHVCLEVRGQPCPALIDAMGRQKLLAALPPTERQAAKEGERDEDNRLERQRPLRRSRRIPLSKRRVRALFAQVPLGLVVVFAEKRIVRSDRIGPPDRRRRWQRAAAARKRRVAQARCDTVVGGSRDREQRREATHDRT